MNYFTPSYLYSLDETDSILSFPFLKFAVQCYVGENMDPNSDPFLSPILASDEVLMIYLTNWQLLSKLPKLRILAGQVDPLYDDNLRFI